MILEVEGYSRILSMSLEEAIAMQRALNEAINRVTVTTTNCALEGRKVKHYGAGESAGSLSVKEGEKFYPSSLTVVVEVGER